MNGVAHHPPENAVIDADHPMLGPADLADHPVGKVALGPADLVDPADQWGPWDRWETAGADHPNGANAAKPPSPMPPSKAG